MQFATCLMTSLNRLFPLLSSLYYYGKQITFGMFLYEIFLLYYYRNFYIRSPIEELLKKPTFTASAIKKVLLDFRIGYFSIWNNEAIPVPQKDFEFIMQEHRDSQSYNASKQVQRI